MPISAEITESNGIASVRLYGDLTTNAAYELEKLFSRLGKTGANRVLLDLANAELIDAQAVSILIEIVVALRMRGGELRIVNAKGTVFEILGYRHFRRFFGLSSTVEEAVSTLSRHDQRRRQLRQQKALVAELA